MSPVERRISESKAAAAPFCSLRVGVVMMVGGGGLSFTNFLTGCPLCSSDKGIVSATISCAVEHFTLHNHPTLM